MEEEFQFLTRAEVGELHEDSLREFGGISGVRDDSLVEGAWGAALNEHLVEVMSLPSRQPMLFIWHKTRPFLMETKELPPRPRWFFSRSMAMQLSMKPKIERPSMTLSSRLPSAGSKPELAALFRKLFAAS